MYWLVYMLSQRLTQTVESGQAQELSVVNILLFHQLCHPPPYRLLSSPSPRGSALEWEDTITSAVRWPGFSPATYKEDLGQMISSLCALFSPGFEIDMEQIIPTF